MNIIENSKWRYATKKYDADKIASKEHIDYIKEAIRLSASSYGLQLYKVLVIQDKEWRDKLKPVCWNQSQVSDASHLFVFCRYAELLDEHIDEYLMLKTNAQGSTLAEVSGYGNFIKNKMKSLGSEFKNNWMAKQTYIALGNAINACAELKIDSTPMEGFDPIQLNVILGLKEKNLHATVLLAVGYRSDQDQTQHQNKVRKSTTDLFEHI